MKFKYGIGFYNMSINNILLICWFFILTIITGLLVTEYRFFKETAIQLNQLKDDYTGYIISLKKLINDHQSKDQLDPELKVQDQKKKIIENMPSFLVVNREKGYLQKSALSFAKLHKLERAIEKLYKAEQWMETQEKLNSIQSVSFNKKVRSIKSKRIEKYRFLQKESIFIWPIKKGQFHLSSLFGPRKHKGQWRDHTGIDLAAIIGTPVYAAAGGKVIEAGYVNGYGNTIVIAHDRKFKTRYAHLSFINVKVGQYVEKSTIIGKVGATGNARPSRPGGSGAHLHFEVCVFDKQVNPFYFLS